MKPSVCVIIAILLSFFTLSGCGVKPAMAEAVEHSEFASMESALATTLYLPDGAGGLITEEKRLPWEMNMGNYALSFLFPDGQVSYSCRSEGHRMEVDLMRFPSFDTAEVEQAAVASVINTLLALPGVEEIALTFDGETLAALKNGTPVNQVFTELVETASSSPSPAQ